MILIRLPPKYISAKPNYFVTDFHGKRHQIVDWVLRNDIKEWLHKNEIELNYLDIRIGPDFEWLIGGKNFYIGFTNEADAVLFRLTWL